MTIPCPLSFPRASVFFRKIDDFAKIMPRTNVSQLFPERIELETVAKSSFWSVNFSSVMLTSVLFCLTGSDAQRTDRRRIVVTHRTIATCASTAQSPVCRPQTDARPGGAERHRVRIALRYFAWNLLPREMDCGSGTACWRRLLAWQQTGVWQHRHETLLAELLSLAKSISRARSSAAHRSAPCWRKKPARIPPDCGQTGHFSLALTIGYSGSRAS